MPKIGIYVLDGFILLELYQGFWLPFEMFFSVIVSAGPLCSLILFILKFIFFYAKNCCTSICVLMRKIWPYVLGIFLTILLWMLSKLCEICNVHIVRIRHILSERVQTDISLQVALIKSLLGDLGDALRSSLN